MRFKIGIGLLVALFMQRAMRAAEANQRLDIELPAVHWQQPPSGVLSVVVGPDGRSWFQLNANPQGKSLQEIRRLLESEYRQSAPQISGASLALLEPEGRAWFYVNLAKTLWGYDGRQWVERAAPPGSNFVGTCPTRGALPDNLSNRFAGGKAWFREWQGVHVFDGHDWSYEPFYIRKGYQGNEQPRYAVSPNGQFAAALRAKRNPDNSVSGYELWVIRDGKWRQHGSVGADRRGYVGSFCVTNDGVLWYVWNAAALRSIDLSEKPSGDKSAVERLIAQLGHEQFAVREEATEKLAQLGAAIKAELEAARTTMGDAEIKLRLAHLLERLEQPLDRPNEEVARLGECQVRNVVAIFQDEDGRRYVFSEAIAREGQPTTSGLLVVAPDEKPSIYPLAGDLGGMQAIASALPSPVRTPRDDGLWLPRFIRGPALRLLDFQTGRLAVQDVPDGQFVCLQAIDNEGRLFVSRREPNALGIHATSLAVLDLRVPDRRSLLDVSSFEISRGEFAVDSHGNVWAHRDESLTRFDGHTWDTVYANKDAYLIPGAGGVVVARGTSAYLLFQDGKLLGQGDLKELVEAQRELIASAFGPATDQMAHRHSETSLTADRAGNIWLLTTGRVTVLTDGKWVETKETLKAAGSRDGDVAFLSAVGDGSKVYLSDLNLVHDGGKSYLAEIKDGTVRVEAAPHAARDNDAPLGIRDAEVALWIPRYIAVSQRVSDHIIGQRATRLGTEGMLQEFENYWPLLLDRSENVWLTKVRPTQSNQLQIWRQGRIIQDLKISGTDAVYALVSDKPGSVYAWTSLGLQHLVADDKSHQYRLAQTYSLGQFSGSATSWSHSALGFFVIGTLTEYPRQHHIHLVRLPK